MQVRRVTFRLYPTLEQENELHWARKMHKDLYNAALANRKTQYQHFNHSVDYFEQQNSLPAFKEVWSEYKRLNSMSLQATLKRVDYAFQRFFKGLSKYPRFKSVHRYSGWTYPDARQGFKVHSIGDNGYLELTDLGFQLQMRGKARTWGTPTSCTIVYRNGKWYASITVNCIPKRTTGFGVAGIDFGVEVAAAVANKGEGFFVENPRWHSQMLPRIKKASKDKRRKRAPNGKKRVKASRRWKKSQRKVSKLQRKVANQRANWQHQVSAQIVSSHSLVGTEELELQKMTRASQKGSKRKRQKTGLNRSMLDVGIGGFHQAVKYKVEEAGGMFVEVPTKKVKPSQTCPKCLHQKKKELSERIHCCENCGYTQQRDMAFAEVCRDWVLGSAVLGTSVDRRGVASSTSATKTRKHCGAMEQLGTAKRQKSRSAGGDSETPPSTESRAG